MTAVIPGLSTSQANDILGVAFSRNSSVVFGGSRISGHFRESSDLNVGFGGLTVKQASRVINRLNRLAATTGGLPLNTTIIVPGNQTPSIPRITTPEEFFQRSGVRRGNSAAGSSTFQPSGSITVNRDGTITLRPPGQ
jgi:hypothetical protein